MGRNGCAAADLERRLCEQVAEQKVEPADYLRSRGLAAGNVEKLLPQPARVDDRHKGEQADPELVERSRQAHERRVNTVH